MPSAVSRAPSARLRELRDLRREVRQLRRENSHLRRENDKLKALLEEARRAHKRQAAPFSRNQPKAQPKKPGRRPGTDYGRRGTRPIPDHVDEVLEAPLPPTSPCCGAGIDETNVEVQYQEDIPQPIQTHVTQSNVHVGRCLKCGRQVRGRHALQCSLALHAAGNQIGPNALALAAHMNKDLGVSYGRLVLFFATTFQLVVAKATLVRGLQRVADRAEPLYEQIVVMVRSSGVVYPDETGWRIGARGAWLWDFVCSVATLYVIRPSRGFDVIEEVLGSDYAGIVGCDGWAPYQRLAKALLQTCNAHLLRRCHELLEVATRGAVRFPRAVQALLLAGLALRDRHEAEEVSTHGLAVACGKLQAKVHRLLHETQLSNADNARFAKHLRNHEPEIFRYLEFPEVEATNWPSEQELRPAVVTRKLSAGNRSTRGAHTQEVLASVLRTAVRQGRPPMELLVQVLRAASPEEMPSFRDFTARRRLEHERYPARYLPYCGAPGPPH